MVNTSKNTIVLETTQAALADTIGVTRVSVANTLAELEREGLVRRGYGAIEIPDVKGLLSWVEQSSQLTPVD
jgi:CRP-like cAMP-binding protein